MHLVQNAWHIWVYSCQETIFQIFMLQCHILPNKHPATILCKGIQTEDIRDAAVTKKMDPHEIVPPGPTTSKYLDPLVQILQVSTEAFGPPLKWVDPHGVQLLRSNWTPQSKYFKVVLKYLDPRSKHFKWYQSIRTPSAVNRNSQYNSSLKCYYEAWIWHETTITLKLLWHYILIIIIHTNQKKGTKTT